MHPKREKYPARCGLARRVLRLSPFNRNSKLGTCSYRKVITLFSLLRMAGGRFLDIASVNPVFFFAQSLAHMALQGE